MFSAPINKEGLDVLLEKYPGSYFVDNCTFANPLFMGLFNNAPCAGHGECDNGICTCHDGYRGVGDLFDLRGISCHNRIIGEQVTWLFVAVAMVGAWFLYLRAINSKFETLREKFRHDNGSGSTGRFLVACTKFFPFKVLVPFAMLGIPSFVVLAGIRSFNDDMSIGNDPVTTVLLLIGALTGFISQQESGLEQFNHVARGSLLRSAEGRRIKRQYKLIVRGGSLFYIVGKLPLLVLLFLPGKPFNPLVYPLIIVNNLLVAMYLVVFSLSSHHVYSKLHSLRQTMRSAGGNTSTSDAVAHGNSKSDKTVSSKRLELVLEYMHETGDTNRKAAIVGSITYILFSTPWFIGLQGYMFPIIFLFALKSNIKLAQTFAVGTRTYQKSKGQTTRTDGNTTDISPHTQSQYESNATRNYTSSIDDSAVQGSQVYSLQNTDTLDRVAKVSVAEFMELDSEDELDVVVPEGQSVTAKDLIDGVI